MTCGAMMFVRVATVKRVVGGYDVGKSDFQGEFARYLI